MQDRLSTYPGRVKLVPVSGQENTYDLERADEPSQLGTELKRDTLLSDATATLLGLNSSATPNTAFARVKTLMDILEGKIGASKKGSYVGNDTYGVNNMCSLTFEFEPQVLILDGHALVRGTRDLSVSGGYCYFTWSGKTVSWYSPQGYSAQMNSSLTTYHYFALTMQDSAGNTGTGTPGADGFSPIVTMTNITGGVRLSIQDAEDTETHDIMDGVSPTITTSQISGGTRVTIVDKDGTKYFDVLNGTNSSGESSGSGSGTDEFSPTITIETIEGGHKITVTDKDGTESFNVLDGETPVKGTDYFTSADKQEIAQAAAELVDITAADVGAGTFPATDIKAATGTDYDTARVRNISAGTADMTAGTTTLSSGDIYIMYE